MPNERPATWDDIIRHEAGQAGVPAELALAIADTESGFDPKATSPKGAHGLFQLMPETAKELGVDPADPVQNIRGGLKYFKQQLDAHGGNVEKALQSYNWGPGNVAKGGTPPPETQAYVTRILGRLKPAAAAPPATLPVITLQQSTQNISQPAARNGPVVATPPPTGKGFVNTLVEGLDPTRRTGRRNLAGGAGDIVGTSVGALVGTALAPFTGGTSAVAGPIVGGTLGAAAGGGLAEYGEQLAGTEPNEDTSVMSGTDESKIGWAAAEQGGYAVGGRVIAWPFRAAGKRLVATRVGRLAADHFEDVLSTARDALQNARTAASDAVTAASDSASSTLASVRAAAGEHIGKAKQFGRELVGDTTAAAKSGAEKISDRYGKVATAPPSVTPSVAGQRANKIVEGPARQAREEIGQMVEDAAHSGPDVDITALKAEAQRVLGEEIRPPQTAFPKGAPVTAEEGADPAVAQLEQLAANLTPEAMATLSPSQKVQAQAIHDALAAAQQGQAETVLKHPAMSVLGRILNAEDTVPFHAAHQFKRELDDAIGTAWDKSVRSRVTNITKHMRGELRSALSVHEPYNVATAAYQSIAPLYTKGLAPKLRRAAMEAPEAIVRLIKPNDPTQLKMLRDLLVTMPGKVDRQHEGQFAWDSVRSAWTHQHIIKGPLESLDARIAKLDPEFAQTMYGDGPGSMVLDNLQKISTAYKQAIEDGAAAVSAAKGRASAGVDEARQLGSAAVDATAAAGKATVRGARQQGKQLVGTKISDLASLRGQARDLARSSLRNSQGEVLSDVLRAMALGPGSKWGGLSIIRLLRGPKSADLIQYAAYSPEGTRLLVRGLTGPEPGLAIAELLRMTGVGEVDVNGGGVGTPPPMAPVPSHAPQSAQVGAPPPQ